MEKKLEDARVFFDSLEKFLAHTADQSTEELELELQEEGVDTHGLVSRVKSIVHEKLNEARLHWQKEAEEERRSALAGLAATAGKAWNALSRAEILARIQELIGSHGQELSLEYRNLEAMTEDDLRNTLIELEALVAAASENDQAGE